MHTHDDIVDLAPAERFREIANILAAGILRLRRHAGDAQRSEKHFESPRNCLELANDPWLSVPAG